MVNRGSHCRRMVGPWPGSRVDRVSIDLDAVATAFADTWEVLLGCTPGWWAERRRGLVGGVTKVRLPTFNGVWAYGLDPDLDAADELLDRVSGAGLPYCLQARPEAAQAAELAARRGMEAEADVPLMVLEDPASVADPAAPGLTIRELPPVDRHEHATLAAAGFEIDEEYFVALITPEVVDLRGMRSYIGEVDERPVTTGVGFTRGDWVGVFNIATPPAHRRRGYGAAVTMRAVRDGLADGARWAWLQASPAGRPVYERLGFRTLTSWRCWISAPA